MSGNGVKIGRLYGISIRVDWSWLLIMVLIIWNLVTAFHSIHPTWGSGVIWGISILAAFLFFLSVLAHELAHSLVALSQGLPVRNITLYLFGGVSNIQREPSKPIDEFWMAIAGPLTSLVLGIIMLALALGSAVIQTGFTNPTLLLRNLSPLATILLWLGSVNLILAVFNMIPGFPLDGGRVLRSIFWGVTKNLSQATRWAAWIGQVIAWIMIIAGISMAFGVRIPLLGSGIFNGLWLAFIGWFLNSASMQSHQQIQIQDMLEGVPVSRIMRPNPPTVEPDCTVDDLLHTHVLGSDDQAFPVLENERLVGIVTLDDMRKVDRQHWATTQVADIMTPGANLVTIAPNEDASSALQKIMERDVRQLPVVQTHPPADGSELIGLLRRRDIMRYLQLHSESGNSRKPV